MCGAAGGYWGVRLPLWTAAYRSSAYISSVHGCLADAPVDLALALGSSRTWLLRPQTGPHVCAQVCAR